MPLTSDGKSWDLTAMMKKCKSHEIPVLMTIPIMFSDSCIEGGRMIELLELLVTELKAASNELTNGKRDC